MEGNAEFHRKKSEYDIKGKLDLENIKDIPKGLKLKVYAIRERRVLGSSPISSDGSFNIRYSYEIHEIRGKKAALAPSLIVGPDMPKDSILKTRPRIVPLSAEDFKEKKGVFVTDIKEMLPSDIVPISTYWWQETCFEQWRPCIEVRVCSGIIGSLCYGEEPAPIVRVKIYEVREPTVWGGMGPNRTVLIAEGDTDEFGYFRTEQTRLRCLPPLWDFPLYTRLGYIVEIGQIVDGQFISIYKESEDKIRDLPSDLCEEIYIDKSGIIIPQIPEGILTGNTFKLTRIGDIPVGYINQDEASSFYGYADTTDATDSATLRVSDSAFYGSIKLYANIGSGLLDAVKHYRIKCTYSANGETIENYLQVPFYNLRESTEAEKLVSGPYKTEFMGPFDEDVYIYPNPYDLAVDKQWIYKGLVMVLNTATLAPPYGLLTITVELLDVNKQKIPDSEIDSLQDLTCTILVDNTAPTGSIGDIIGPSGIAPACGFIKMPSASPSTRVAICDGVSYTRHRVIGKISVPFSAQDEHGNIQSLVLNAHFGCNEYETLVGNPPGGKERPLKGGCAGTVEYQEYNDVPQASRPIWNGSSDYCKSTSTFKVWDECAYQLRLTIFKRVTDGEYKYPWWDFTKHITILRNTI